MSDPNRFSQQMTLPYSAVNANGYGRAEWLLNAFQDVATRHFQALGISGFDMAPKGLKWVVAQMDVTLPRPLQWLTPFTLVTWRAPWKNLYEIRHFSIMDPEGKELAHAKGVWILIKAANGRPVRLKSHLPEHLMRVRGEDPELIKSHPPLESPGFEAEFKVLFQDLDMNQHVNNGVYLKWAQETLPFGFTHRPVRCTLSYIHECLYNNNVVCRAVTEKISNGFLSHHAVVRKEDETVLARIRLQWEKIEDAPLLHD